MRVAFVNSLYPPWSSGGAESTLRGLAEGLVRRGAEVDLYCLTPEAPQQTIMGGVQVHYLPARTAIWPWMETPPLLGRLLFQLQEIYNPFAERDLYRAWRASRPDIVHVHNFKGFSALAAWRAARRLRLPLVQTLHDYTLVCPRSVMRKAGRNCARPCLSCRVASAPRRARAGWPDLFTAVSHRMVELMEQSEVHWRRKPLIVRGDNPPGPTASRPPQSREVVFGYLGRLDPAKGVDVLLRALRHYRGPECRVLIAGAGAAPYTEALRKLAVDTVAEFVGWRDSAEFFQEIDVLVVPSLWEEPLGRVIHEAFKFGVPVISADIGGMPEIVQPDVNGMLAPPGDYIELAAVMARLASSKDMIQALGEGARRSAVLFDGEVIHDQYECALRSVLTAR